MQTSRILVVEDDKYFNQFLCDRLLLEGFDVVGVYDGESAWNALQEAVKSSQSFDWLLSDMLLPKMMGAELFSRVREAEGLSDLKIVACSGVYKDPAQISALSDLHQLSGYWIKPFDLDKLVAALTGKDFVEAALSGTLSQKPIEVLFHEIYRRGFTGVLRLHKDSYERRIYFSGGFPVNADSSGLSESLGDALVRFGLIDQKKREEASAQMVAEKLQFGQVLLKRGDITKDQLFSALRKHSYQLLLQTFSWREGSYTFENFAELPTSLIALEFNPFLMMFRAQKTLYSLDFLTSYFKLKHDLFCSRSKECHQILTLLNVEDNSLKFFIELPQDLTFEKILGLVPTPNHELLYRVFYFLESLKLVEWVSEAPPKTAPSSNVAIPSVVLPTPDPSLISEEVNKAIQSEYMDLVSKNYFEVLGVTPQANAEEIENAYRKIRIRLHPDEFGAKLSRESHRVLADILSRTDKAYQTLSSAELRGEYLRHFEKTKNDSALDSKRYLEAQEISRTGLRFLSNKEYRDARLAFEKASQLWSRGVEYRLYATYAELREVLAAGQKPQAEGLLRKLKADLDLYPHSDTVYVLLGHAYSAFERDSFAREAYEEALKINPQSDEASLALTRLSKNNAAKEPAKKLLSQSTSRFRKSLVYILLVVGVLFIAYAEHHYLAPEKGIERLDVSEFRETLPVESFTRKAETGKVVLSENWIHEAPQPVRESACHSLLAAVKARGITDLFFYDAKDGIKIYCRENMIVWY